MTLGRGFVEIDENFLNGSRWHQCIRHTATTFSTWEGTIDEAWDYKLDRNVLNLHADLWTDPMTPRSSVEI
jgi:hypothetical protein